MDQKAEPRDPRDAWVWWVAGCGGLALSLSCIAVPVYYVLSTRTEDPAPDVPAPLSPVLPDPADPLPAPSTPSPSLPVPPTPPSGDSRRVTAIVEEARGLRGIAVGNTCSVDVTRHDQPDQTFSCRAQVSCAGQVLYGGPSAGFFDCTLYEAPERHVVGEDRDTTSGDRDPAMRIDTLRGVLSVRDDASGRLGEVTLRARVTNVR